MQASRFMNFMISASHLSKNVFLAAVGNSSLNIIFRPLSGKQISRACCFWLLLLLCCSFGSLCVRSLSPSETACGSIPVLFSPLGPAYKNDCMHSACNFVKFFSCFTHTFLLNLRNLFWKQLPAFIGKHDSENCIKTKSCPKDLSRHSHRTDYTHFGAVDRIWNLQTRFEKSQFLADGPSLEALFAIMCSAACVLDDIFTCSPHFHYHFAQKWTLLSEVKSHKYVRLTLPARYVIYMSPWRLRLESIEPIESLESIESCSCLPNMNWRAAVCPPQRAFNKYWKVGTQESQNTVPVKKGGPFLIAHGVISKPMPSCLICGSHYGRTHWTFWRIAGSPRYLA